MVYAVMAGLPRLIPAQCRILHEKLKWEEEKIDAVLEGLSQKSIIRIMPISPYGCQISVATIEHELTADEEALIQTLHLFRYSTR